MEIIQKSNEHILKLVIRKTCVETKKIAYERTTYGPLK